MLCGSSFRQLTVSSVLDLLRSVLTDVTTCVCMWEGRGVCGREGVGGGGGAVWVYVCGGVGGGGGERIG